MDLFAIAAKLNVQRLKLIAENLIIKSLDQENAQKVFNLAHKYNSENLKKFAFKEISNMYADADLPDGLMNDSKSLKDWIDLKVQADCILNKFRNL
jgi:hypothetical protein